MDHKTVEEYVMSMPNAKLTYPFGEDVAVYKVFVPNPSVTHADGAQGAGEDTKGAVHIGTATENRSPATQRAAARTVRDSSSAGEHDSAGRGDWKMFALIQEHKEPVRISLKCDPQLSKLLREKYDEVMEGYHLNKKHWITIVLTGQLSWQEIQGLIRHSYELVAHSNSDVPEFN